MVLPNRPAYLLRHELSSAHVYQGAHGKLFIDEYAKGLVDWSRFPDLQLKQIDVLERPLDGLVLPGDPD